MKGKSVLPKTSRLLLSLYLVSLAVSLAAGLVPLYSYLHL